MMKVSVHDFQRQADCIYYDEQYSVRDNGAVLRHPRVGKRSRLTDGKWVFGKTNTQNGYLYISQKRIHRIVATAFHGTPPAPEYVVDHIDTNRQNNRPENLRWVTRLENALNNPVTRKKIEYLCGSIEAFLEKPSMLNDLQGVPNFKWMCEVSLEEAKNCKVRMEAWASSAPTKQSPSGAKIQTQDVFNRIYKPFTKGEVGLPREPGLDFALTPRSAQYMWSPNIHFPCCPSVTGAHPLDDYLQNLSTGVVLAYSEDPEVCPELTVHQVEYLRDRPAILVLCKRPDFKSAIVGVELGGRVPHFIHFNLGKYSGEMEAREALQKKATCNFWGDTFSVIPFRRGIEVEKMEQGGLDAAKKAGMRPGPEPLPDYVYANNAWMNKRLAGRGITLSGHVRSKYGKSNFQCRNGHEWRTVPNDVAEGKGCPRCGIGEKDAEEIRQAVKTGYLLLLIHPEKPGFIRIELTYRTPDHCDQDNVWDNWQIHRYREVEEPALAESLIGELLDYPRPGDREPVNVDLSIAEQAFRNLIDAMQSEIALVEKKKEDVP